jgi:hypothetical protein
MPIKRKLQPQSCPAKNTIICSYKNQWAKIVKRQNAFESVIAKQHRETKKALKGIDTTLKDFNTIQLNGDGKETSFKDAFREVYMVNKSAIEARHAKVSFGNWLHSTSTGSVLRSRISKFFITLIIVWIVVSSLYTLGFFPMHPMDIMSKCWDKLWKLL